MPLYPVASYRIEATRGSFTLRIARGSNVHFSYPRNPQRSAIVNAADKKCVYGKGIDGRINDAGGRQLIADRKALPVLSGAGTRWAVRCETGKAKMTGPNYPSYGSLHVPYVIHAVGPNYNGWKTERGWSTGDGQLADAYDASLECGKRANLEAIAFTLLSAGYFRGSRTRKQVLRIGMGTICDYEGYAGLREVWMCGYKEEEVNALLEIADEMGLSRVNENPTSNTGDSRSVARRPTRDKKRKAAGVSPSPKKPASAKPKTDSKAGPKTETNFTFFSDADGENGYLSNWYESDIVDDAGNPFPTGQHYLMYRKALLFGDKRKASEILEKSSLGCTPKVARDLGIKIRGFKEATWAANREDIMDGVQLLKFRQNAPLRQMLLDTGDSVIAEASRNEEWGIGIEGPAARNPDNWTGLNLLGESLMRARKQLKQERTIDLTGN